MTNENLRLPLTIFAFLTLSALSSSLKAQKPDSIFFNLYTDSLKKGTYNYINIDGKYSNGTWLPLTAKEINFSSTDGKFEENSLFIDKDFKGEKVTVKAVLKADASICKTITIFIKKSESNEKLKTPEEIMKEIEQQGKQRRKKG